MYTIPCAITDFLAHCKFEKNLSEKTIKAYQTDLLQMSEFMKARNCPLDIGGITKIHLREYLAVISSLKPKSVKRKIASIKVMFNFLEFEDSITVNPLRKMRIVIKEPERLPKVLNIIEVRTIFQCAYDRKEKIEGKKSYSYLEALRNIVVIELLFCTGARVSEIANLKMENIDLDSGVIILKGKGNKERMIQVCNKETLKILNKYSSSFRKKIIETDGFFLINRFGKKLSDQSIRNIVKNLRENAGIDKHITPHTFRHSFATLLLEKDVDIKYIQSLLGHSSIMTTQIYTHVNREKQKQILVAKHPRRDFYMR